jgi:cysteine desulfurase/selenocysteine lyase
MDKIIYLDAAASSLKPQSVIGAQVCFLQNNYANSGRGVCARAAAVDDMVGKARARVAKFINAVPDQIIFTANATDGLNRARNILEASKAFSEDSVVVVSDLDHHSARLPWENAARLGKCKIIAAKLDGDFDIDPTGIGIADVFVITAMSNVLGRAQDVKKLIAAAKSANPNVITIVDAAQYVAHLPVDAADWDCDFLCFSGHKIGADTGIGIMYVKQPGRWAADKLGGGMVAKVSEKKDNSGGAASEWVLADGPAKFEAGTLPLTQIAGLIPAIDYLEARRGGHELIKRLHSELSKIERIKIITGPDAAMLTFVIDGMHPLDFGALAGANGVCLRVGNMCASWLHRALGLAGTIRISAGPWNTAREIDTAAGIIKKILE